VAKAVDVSLIGDKRLNRKLRRLPLKVQRKVVRQALREAGRPVLATAKRIVPVRTGNLRDGLKLRAIKPRGGQFGVAIKTPTREDLGLPATGGGYYPAHIELGTRNTPAQPYLRPAMDQNRKKSIGILRRQIGAGIEREARRS